MRSRSSRTQLAIVMATMLTVIAGGLCVAGCAASEDTSPERVGQGESPVAGAPYGAGYVSQSFPLATTALKMKAGQVIPSYIELKNIGTNDWDTNTKIGTTEPRDRASLFADSTWISPSRAGAVTGTVAPGGTFKFTFDLEAPSTPGTYEEFFGVVEEGVVWFGDPNQGGPVDNDLEVKVEVTAADPVSDSGSTDPGSDAGDADGGPISVSQIPVGTDGGESATHPAPSDDGQTSAQHGGCTIGASPGSSSPTGPSSMLVALTALAALAALRLATKKAPRKLQPHL